MRITIWPYLIAVSIIVFGISCKRTRTKANSSLPKVDLLFNGNCLDNSYLKNRVIVHGNVVPASDRFGNANSAMEFDGISSYLEIPHKKEFRGDGILVMAWVYAKDFKFYSNGVSSMDDYSGFFNKWDQKNKKGISTYSTYKQCRANGHFGDGGFFDKGSQKGTFLSKNTWHHVAYKICNGLVTYYLDGKEISKEQYSNKSGLYTVNDAIEIGRTHWYPSQSQMTSYFTGLLDDLKIYYGCANVNISDIAQKKP